MRQVRIYPDFADWQRAAKWLLMERTPPHHVVWVERFTGHSAENGAEQASLFAMAEEFHKDHPATLAVPSRFVELARIAACHRSPTHWELMYRVLWRLLHEDRNLARITVDPDVRELVELAHQVRCDAHHMVSFVRFREMKAEERLVAWYRPDHRVTGRVARAFVRRMRNLRWSILTPDECAHWDTRELTFTPGVARALAPAEDDMEDLWREYYRSTFNPARVNPTQMRQYMPARYWENLPEAEIIREVIAESPARVEQMLRTTATPRKPRTPAKQ